MRLPVVKLTDGSSGGGSVSTIKKTGYSYIPMVLGMEHAAEQIRTVLSSYRIVRRRRFHLFLRTMTLSAGYVLSYGLSFLDGE